MYQFYYEKINKLWSSNEIIGFDTDSFFLNIQTKDVYEDLKLIQDDLDTSNYSCHWPEGDAVVLFFQIGIKTLYVSLKMN